ncbi:MAG: hypothetical protein K2K50_06700, partial [Anaeroplasmataceae bacterium]|nr:hypothetical protein [Anaeroplasmataceae bacterium]
SIDNRYKSDKRFFTSCPMGKYSKEDYINKLADPHMDSNGDLYLCGLVLKNKSFCIGNILEDTKEKIVSMIDDLAKKISKQKWKDCCPILNRNVEENRCLVCPIVYIKEGGLKL